MLIQTWKFLDLFITSCQGKHLVIDRGILLEDVYTQTVQAKMLQGRSFSLPSVFAIESVSFHITSEDCSKPLEEKQQEGWKRHTVWIWLLGLLDNTELMKLSACLFTACTKPRKDCGVLGQPRISSQGITDLGMLEQLKAQTLNVLRFDG